MRFCTLSVRSTVTTLLAHALTSITMAAPASIGCGQSAESCYLPHSSAGCADATCCNAVCAEDPFCCDFVWDSLCVNGAAELCGPGFASTWATNPINGHRYRLVSRETFPEAGTFLSSVGSNFVSIDNARENDWVRREFVAGFPGLPIDSMLIGFTDYIDEGNFFWTNGSPVSFTRWQAGEPNNIVNEDAVALSGFLGTWSDVAFNINFYSIAEAFIADCGGAAGSCFEPHGPHCNDESCCNEVCLLDPFCCAFSWDGLCVDRAFEYCNVEAVGEPIVNPATRSRYLLVDGGSWLQAAKVAAQYKGHLVAVESAAENEWLRLNFLSGTPSAVWIGLTDQKREGSFQWTGGVTPTFSNWGPGEPNDAEGGEDYTLMYANGLWNDTTNYLTILAIVEIPCEGDLNGDGFINGSDLATLLGAWGSAASNADFDSNATVDAADLAVLLGAWGACVTSNACVARTTPGSDQPGCTTCVCSLDPFCCNVQWDQICVDEAAGVCNAACQCGG